MSHRMPTTAVVRSLFSNVPVESGRSDAEIVSTVRPHIPHATFSRLRMRVPESISHSQLLMLARMAQQYAGADAADILKLVRFPVEFENHHLHATLVAEVYRRSPKELRELESRVHILAAASARLLVFDRSGISFPYLSPSPEIEPHNGSSSTVLISKWTQGPPLHYDRCPRVFVNLTRTSLHRRLEKYGDAGMEELIGGIDSGQNSLVIADDNPRRYHRIFRGIFADAEAAVVFDRAAMAVLPRHRRSIRFFDRRHGEHHVRIIEDAIRYFRHMRKYPIHQPSRAAVRRILRAQLSYCIPSWREAL